MLDGKALRAGCIRYWTWSLIGRNPSTTNLSNSDWESPARAAFLHITTGPSWQWSPTNTIWRGKLICINSSPRVPKHSYSRKQTFTFPVDQPNQGTIPWSYESLPVNFFKNICGWIDCHITLQHSRMFDHWCIQSEKYQMILKSSLPGTLTESSGFLQNSVVSTCLQPSITGIIHSGSVACVDSSISTARNCILPRRGSPEPTHVQHMTSAC